MQRQLLEYDVGSIGGEAESTFDGPIGLVSEVFGGEPGTGRQELGDAGACRCCLTNSAWCQSDWENERIFLGA